MRYAGTALLITISGLALSTVAQAAPPAFTLSSVLKSGDLLGPVINDPFMDPFGVVSNPFAFVQGGGVGVRGVAVNNSGAWLAQAHVVQTIVSKDEALLKSTGGLTPFIAEGTAGYLAEPDSRYAVNGFFSYSLANSGNALSSVGLMDPRLAPADPLAPSSGVYFNSSKSVAIQGQLVNAAGLAAGTTWNAFDVDTVVKLTASGRVLVVSKVTESGIVRRIVAVLTIDANGVVTSTSLKAKEGGPVGAGPDTWVTIAGGGHAAAMNEAGTVVFSGTTSSGVHGVYSGTGFVAVQGGATPAPGQTWGELAGAPVDINSAGTVALRGLLANGNGFYTESATDAGEDINQADRTFGNGPLTRITGSLSNDLDVDMYRIVVTDAASFSATTVPDPGNGFAGATWDTVLTLIAEPGNGTRGRVRCNNVSAGVLQSTITGAQTVTGREYYLCISSPKSRPAARVWHYATGSFPNYDIWTDDPAGVAAGGGMVYWPDPSAAAIRRSTTGGVIQSDLPATAIVPNVAVDTAGGKIYWSDDGSPEKIRRSNLDGSAPEDIVTTTGFGNITASDCTGIALDTINGKIYWSRSVFGEISRCDLNGANQERVLQDYPPTSVSYPHAVPTGTLAPSSLAVDGAGGKVYWVNTFLNAIERSNLDGTVRETVVASADATALVLSTATGRIYWTSTTGNKIRRSNLDGTAAQDVLSTSAPSALAIDAAAGKLYWTNTVQRVVRSANLDGTGAADVVSAGADVGQTVPDGPGASSAFAVWLRSGTATPGSLPYSIRLTGATFKHEYTMIAKGSQKVVAVGDVIPGTAPNNVTVIGSATSPIRISDRGDVLWLGYYAAPTIYDNFLYDAAFFNGERLLRSGDIPAGTNMNDQLVINFYRGAYSLDMSDNGEYAMIATNMQVPNYNFTAQPDNALLFHFSLPPQCIADFNHSGAVTVQDIFDFLAAWFAGNASADVNGSGSVTVQDIFDFLAAWFAGCPNP